MSLSRSTARLSALRARGSCSGAPSASRLITPTSTRIASTLTSLACSESLTRRASAGATSVTTSTSPSVVHTRSRASAADRSLRKTTRSRRGPRSRFQWSGLVRRQPHTGERVGLHQGDLDLQRRVTLGEGERSGAPRARCVDHSPMALTGATLAVAEALLLPKARARDVEATEFAQHQSVRLREAHADGVGVDDL